MLDPAGSVSEDSMRPFQSLLRRVGQEMELENLAVLRTHSMMSGLLSLNAAHRAVAAELMFDTLGTGPGEYRIAVVSTDTAEPAEDFGTVVWPHVYAEYPAWGVVDGLHVVLMTRPCPAPHKATISRSQSSVDDANSTLIRWPGQLPAPLIGLGGWVSSAGDIRQSHRQALKALRFARTGLLSARTSEWEQLGAWRPLLLLSRDDAVGSLDRRMADLVANEDRDTLVMVQSYLERREEVSIISATFNVHRTTFYSRIRRLQDRYGLDWDDAEDRLLTITGIRIALLYLAESSCDAP
ncbi:helix-turn-helix domain-containing protein [Rhodococcoides fascians]|uniref:helix-turn-helix domain-containing protein n=1 Tax=Rhodococcoides fascians TaxID=1828 RepID=UPI0015C665DA|nr:MULTISPECIES: helix-turn-helix domain-containing protein [Rhodococcus]